MIAMRIDGSGEQPLEYWVERERVWKSGGGRRGEWKDVDDIFVDEPEEVTELQKNLYSSC